RNAFLWWIERRRNGSRPTDFASKREEGLETRESLAAEGASRAGSRMNPERWRQIERIYHGALEQDSVQRESFVAQACESDDELRREVLALLAQPQEGDKLDQPAWQAGAHLLAETVTPELKTGATIGAYRIEGFLGAGGMGQVYRAIDTRLNRSIAIKFLSERLGNESGRRRL